METNDRIVKTYGVVIAENNSGDYNRVITILTSKFGKITAIARGARRTKSNLLASTSLLSFANGVILMVFVPVLVQSFLGVAYGV